MRKAINVINSEIKWRNEKLEECRSKLDQEDHFWGTTSHLLIKIKIKHLLKEIETLKNLKKLLEERK